MASVEQSVEVKAPIGPVYNQWTQFEDFPRFMEGVEEVVQLDDVSLRWRVKIAGQEREWDAKITEQIPEERIAWAATGQTSNAGVVTFHRIDDQTTKVMLQLEYETDDLAEKAGDALGIIKRRVVGDLERFKEFIESRGGQETGAWRGEVERPDKS